MYKRVEYHIIKKRLEEPRRFVQVVMGARQIGKSTVVKQVLNDLTIPYMYPPLTVLGSPTVGRQFAVLKRAKGMRVLCLLLMRYRR